MHILLTNDDGIYSALLAAIYKQLSIIADVTVVAPSEAKSGSSHSITLESLSCHMVDIMGKFIGYSIEGTPADCVKLGINGMLNKKAKPIDMVISGINLGANIGLHVHYSGTVAAAKEAAFYGLPAIAISTEFDDKIDNEKIAEYAFKIIQKLLPLKKGDIININIPAMSKDEPKGVKIVSHSTKGFNENIESQTNGDSMTFFQYTGGNHHDETSEGVDTTEMTQGYTTITAMDLDMTDYDRNKELKNIQW